MTLYYSDQAVRVLSEALDAHSVGPEHAMRLVERGTRDFVFELANPLPDDEVISRNGRPVVLVPPALSEELHGGMLDATLDDRGEPEVGIRMPAYGGDTDWVAVEVPGGTEGIRDVARDD